MPWTIAVGNYLDCIEDRWPGRQRSANRNIALMSVHHVHTLHTSAIKPWMKYAHGGRDKSHGFRCLGKPRLVLRRGLEDFLEMLRNMQRKMWSLSSTIVSTSSKIPTRTYLMTLVKPPWRDIQASWEEFVAVFDVAIEPILFSPAFSRTTLSSFFLKPLVQQLCCFEDLCLQLLQISSRSYDTIMEESPT